MTVTDYVIQYLDSMTKEQLSEMIRSNRSLVSELKPIEWQVRLAKRFTKIDVDKQELMRRILRERPGHGQILYAHRDWYDQEMDALKTYIDEL